MTKGKHIVHLEIMVAQRKSENILQSSSLSLLGHLDSKKQTHISGHQHRLEHHLHKHKGSLSFDP